jgi:hypothetical protein
LAVLAWAAFTVLLIMVNGSYWPQYYVQLAVPLSVLGGGLLDARVRSSLLLGRVKSSRNLVLRSPVLIAILAVGLITGQIGAQYADTMAMIDQVSPVYVQVADYLRRGTSPEDTILVFEPNYTFLSSRPPAGWQPGHFLVDSYGEMLYANLGIGESSLLSLMRDVLSGTRRELQATFWRAPAQEQLLVAFDRAEYVVIDGRARYQLEPRTLGTITMGSAEVFATGPASVRRRR